MHQVKNGSVRRAVRLESGVALMEVSGIKNGVRVEVLSGDATQEDCEVFVEEWLDLERDLRPFYLLLKHDPDFSFLADRYRGFHMVGIPDLYECLLWSITGQQINLSFAYKLKRRLVEAFGDHIRHGKNSYWLFPLPRRIAQCSVYDLRELQFTTRKSEYIIGISQDFVSGILNKEKILRAGSEEAMLEMLLKRRGIGPWTANYALMKSLRAMNRIPTGDAGLHQALARYKGIVKPTPAKVEKLLQPFSGWRTYLVFYLWRSLREMA